MNRSQMWKDRESMPKAEWMKKYGWTRVDPQEFARMAEEQRREQEAFKASGGRIYSFLGFEFRVKKDGR